MNQKVLEIHKKNIIDVQCMFLTTEGTFLSKNVELKGQAVTVWNKEIVIKEQYKSLDIKQKPAFGDR